LAGAERDQVMERLASPDLVAGDFNTPRGSWSIGQLVGLMRHAREDGAGAGVIVTYPRAAPLLHIDHLFVGAKLRARGYRVLDPGVGRHWAQVAEVVDGAQK
jgi:endonuclease/exonuclease/phosphatase family metal-dependent hydrolase